MLFNPCIHEIADTTEIAIKERLMDNFMMALTFKDLKKNLGALEPNVNVHFISKGSWSMHQLLQYVLVQTGLSRVYISTWAIHENQVRELLKLKEDGLIQEIHSIFDYKINDRKTEAYLLAKQNFDRMVLAKCHAKVTLIANDEWFVTINGSANYTRNPRIEVGVLSTGKSVYEFHLKWFEQVLSGEVIV